MYCPICQNKLTVIKTISSNYIQLKCIGTMHKKVNDKYKPVRCSYRKYVRKCEVEE